MSPDEKALHHELVVWLAIRMTHAVFDLPPERRRPCEDGIRTKDCVVSHGFLSAFEAASAVLHRAGVATPSTADGAPVEKTGGPYAYYRIDFDVPQIREHLRRDLVASAYKLPEATGTFLRIATEFHGISTSREPFAAPDEFERVFELMARCGYLESVGSDVKWTNKVTPQMRAIYAWTKQARSEEDLYEARYAVEIEKMWRTLPLKVQKAFFSGRPVDVLSLAVVIERFWIENEWRYIDSLRPDKNVTFRQSDSLRKARELAERYRRSSA